MSFGYDNDEVSLLTSNSDFTRRLTKPSDPGFESLESTSLRSGEGVGDVVVTIVLAVINYAR